MKPGPPTDSLRRVRVLVNPKSGLGFSFDSFWGIVEEQFGPFGADVSYQFSRDVADGRRKAESAVRDGVDALIVVGGDGMVNSIGSALVGTPVALGVVPTGSGNGFARHFGIPLDLPGAVRALARSRRRAIDVGAANGRPFFVTCSLAWDAAIVRGFEAFPFRGIVPYVFAAASELIAYEPQPFEVALDGEPAQVFADPIIFTLANLTQYGGGAQIAPQARSDDGQMEMVVVLRQDLPLVLVNVARLFNGTLDRLPQVLTRRFRTLTVRRRHATPIQLDGELVDAGAEVEIRLLPQTLSVLVPEEAR
ncbi:MAG TPA: diacylglycerol kinase family lipid kinase [Kiritimatiellia bacterium]|nr:diacylglycerol kinase family lipid kinase [Kiritimatiellia bacterium]